MNPDGAKPPEQNPDGSGGARSEQKLSGEGSLPESDQRFFKSDIPAEVETAFDP